MTLEKGKVFNSKILLFGEYSLIVGSMALSIPFEKYSGQLLFDDSSQNSKSNHYSVEYLIDYLQYLRNSEFEGQLNLNNFNKDIEQGLFFETNIPVSYGLGSSGAIVASIYNAYSKEQLTQLKELKDIFSKMESYYHGKSSGLDPLVSYLNKAILISENQEIKTALLPKGNGNSNRGVFLLNTKVIGETQPLINWFLNEYNHPEYKNKIQNQLIPLNNTCVTNFLSGNFNTLISDVKLISEFTFENFKTMIPSSIEAIWKNGIESDNYCLKLCGSGGGGMMLGFTNDLNKVKKELKKYYVHELMRY